VTACATADAQRRSSPNEPLLANAMNLVAQPRRVLELEILRVLVHLRLELADRRGHLIGAQRTQYATGGILDGFPIKTANKISSAAFIWDIDDNGLNEIGVRSSDEILYCWNTPWSFSAAKMTWPKFKKNSSNDGNRLGFLLNTQTGVSENRTSERPMLSFRNPGYRGMVFNIVTAKSALLEVIDISGRIVFSQSVSAGSGSQSVHWKGNGTNGRDLASGVYFVRLSGVETLVKKLLLLP